MNRFFLLLLHDIFKNCHRSAEKNVTFSAVKLVTKLCIGHLNWHQN